MDLAGMGSEGEQGGGGKGRGRERREERRETPWRKEVGGREGERRMSREREERRRREALWGDCFSLSAWDPHVAASHEGSAQVSKRRLFWVAVWLGAWEAGN
jgi:hypothetical protein